MSTPNRVSKGVPTGGQFAASAKGEASVSLRTGPRNLCDLVLAQKVKVRAARDAAQKAKDRVVESSEQARLDVLGEVSIMLARTDLEPDYSMSTEWRRTVLRLGRDSLGAPWPKPDDLTLDHARTCRDFCFAQADRFAIESRVVPDETDREWMDAFEWETRVADHAYGSALAESYASWALAFDQGAAPDAEAVTGLLAALRGRQRDFEVPHRWRGDPAPDRTEAWARATGTTSHIGDHYPASAPPSVG